MAQNFSGRKLWRIAANRHFSGQNIGRLAVLYSKIARIKVMADKTLVDWSLTAKSAKALYLQSFVLYGSYTCHFSFLQFT